MIKKLRLKFVAVCMSMVTFVLAIVFLSAYLAIQQNIENLSLQSLRRAIQDDPPGNGLLFRPDTGINFGSERVLLPYFTVNIWGDTAYVTGGTYSNLEDTETLENILNDCLDEPAAEGVLSQYRLRYLRQDNGLYLKIAFVDMSMERAMLTKTMMSYLLIAGGAFLLLLGVSILLSNWATRPVDKAWRQQRQFLSDASHELKTPLTVILSNAELLDAAQLDDRCIRWTDNIRTEAQQMKSLVEQMLTLARTDDTMRTTVFSKISISEIAENCALAFEPVAYEAGKTLTYDIAADLTVTGDRDKLRQMISIFLDNAIKYSSADGVLRLDLRKNDRQIVLTVSNSGEPIPPAQLPHLFERFYRADASRGETSGFGLGLSIAKAIADEHKWALRAESDAESTRFICTIPIKK